MMWRDLSTGRRILPSTRVGTVGFRTRRVSFVAMCHLAVNGSAILEATPRAHT